MEKELEIIKTGELTQEEKTELGINIDRLIEAHKNNRHSINRLVFESVAAMTDADDAAKKLSRKGTLSRWIGGVTGTNQKLQNAINTNRSAAQYAAQQTLQKLAEQNLMTFDLITAVNNKLNASVSRIDDKFVTVFQFLKKFFDYNRGKLFELEDRLEKVERNLKLERWNTTIKRRMFGCTEYRKLDDVSKIVCLTRDFYELTKGDWNNSDLLLLMDTMEKVGIDPDNEVNYFDSVKQIADDPALTEKLLNGERIQTILDPGFLISMSTFKKLEDFHADEKYTVDAVSELLNENGIEADNDKICAILTKKYMANEAFVNLDMDVTSYDFLLDLLYNLKTAKEEGILSEGNPHSKKDGEAAILYIEAMKYYDGDEVDQDYDKAFKLFSQAAELGYVDAQYYLGEMYSEGQGVEEDPERAFEWYQKAAEQGNTMAQSALATYYFEGIGIERNYQKAFEWHQKAAAKGNIWSNYCLGLLYYNGDGVDKNLEKAAEYYKEAAEQGFDAAQCFYGAMLYHGIGVKQDKQAAAEMYMKSAEQGYPMAQYLYGLMLKEGDIVKQDLKQAYVMILKAAEQEDENAENMIGKMYEIGIGTTKDIYEAVAWYAKAIKHGNMDACCNSARLLQSGEIKGEKGEIDEKIVKLYRAAAEKENMSAQYALGEIYFYGKHGVNQDKDTAKKWLQKAAAQGDKMAENALNNWFNVESKPSAINTDKTKIVAATAGTAAAGAAIAGINPIFSAALALKFFNKSNK